MDRKAERGIVSVNGGKQYDAFVTIDKNLRFQQNVSRIEVKLIILDAPNNRLATLEPYASKLAAILDSPPDDTIIYV